MALGGSGETEDTPPIEIRIAEPTEKAAMSLAIGKNAYIAKQEVVLIGIKV